MSWIIGDIHGEKTLLNKLIDKIGTSEEIYCVGDVIDRGEDPLGCVDICIEKGIKVVKGNHEDMAIDFFFKQGRYQEGIWISNGGIKTFNQINFLIKAELNAKKYIDWMLALPYYYKIDNEPENWIICHGGIKGKDIELQCKGAHPDILWRRKDIRHPELFQVVGHTAKEAPIVNAHYANIDTGAGFSGKLSAIHYPDKGIVSVGKNYG